MIPTGAGQTNPEDAHHQRAKTYWRDCVDARLADAAYYQRQEIALRRMLAAVGERKTALDMGCGDGHFTRIVRDYVPDVRGVDISPQLISKANVIAQSMPGLRFEVLDLEQLGSESVDLVVCNGVISGLFNEGVFSNLVRSLARTTDPAGAVITKDTLGLEGEVRNILGDYAALYRARAEYLRAFEEAGLSLTAEIVLHNDAPRTRNSMFLFGRV